jgi:tyrosine-protein kinase Etk/Wzc
VIVPNSPDVSVPEDGGRERARPGRDASSGIPESGESKNEVNLIDLLLILLNRKWLIFLGTFVVGLASMGAVLLMTSYYTASVVILPSEQKMGLPFGSLLGDLPMNGLMKSLGSLGSSDNSRFMSILDSKRLAENVIRRFDLETRYGFKKKNKKYYFENVLKTYHKNVWSEEDDNGNIKVSVRDSTPQVAADIANYLAMQLDSISYQLSQQSAKGSRLFFEERLKLIRHDMDSVHRAFADFQIANNFIDLDQQVKASIEAMSGVEAEIMATDIEKEMLSSSFGSNSRLSEVNRKKEVLTRRMESYMQNGSGSLVLPLKKTPELGILYANLFRDVKVQEGINGFVLQLYEQAKFREANNSPVVTVLEPAWVPQKRSSPKRMILCLVMTLVAFSMLVTWVLVEHWYKAERLARSATYAKLDQVFAHFRLRR